MAEESQAGEWTNTAGVRKLVNCGIPMVSKLVKRGAFPRVRMGRVWRYRVADVLAWIEKAKVNK